MPTIQNFADTPEKFKVQSICLKRNIKVGGRNNSKCTVFVDVEMGEKKNADGLSVGKHTRKRPLARDGRIALCAP